MMCQRIGRSPMGTIGLGRNSVSSRKRVPNPPQKMTTFIVYQCNSSAQNNPAPGRFAILNATNSDCEFAARCYDSGTQKSGDDTIHNSSDDCDDWQKTDQLPMAKASAPGVLRVGMRLFRLDGQTRRAIPLKLELVQPAPLRQ